MAVIRDNLLRELPQNRIVRQIAHKLGILLYINDTDVSALFLKFLADALADPACAAGHDGHLVLKFHNTLRVLCLFKASPSNSADTPFAHR